MLERAKACFKSRATSTSRCTATSIPKSRRMLHSAFWTHGAETLDIAPYALSSQPPPNLPFQHDSPSRSLRKAQKTPTGHRQVPDGIFLDFLYPPASLALLHRAHVSGSQQFERWEKRNARRLPDGFVQTTRGYASKSGNPATGGRREEALSTEEKGARNTSPSEGIRTGTGRAHIEENQTGDQDSSREVRPSMMSHSAADLAEMEFPELTGEEGDNDRRPHEAGSPMDDMMRPPVRAKFKPLTASPGALVEIERDDLSGEPGSEEKEFEEEASEDGAETAVSTAERVEDVQPTFDVDAVEGQGRRLLLNIVSFSRDTIARMSPEGTERITTRALRIFDTLDEISKGDQRLKTELVSWLALAPETSKDARCMELYESIPRLERTVPLYVAALSIYLRNDMWPKGVQLHKEAIKNVQDAERVTQTFFRHAVDHSRWHLAMHVEAQHRAATADSSTQGAMFWINVSDIPRLLEKCFHLRKYLLTLVSAGTDNPEIHLFCARFFKEGLAQELLARETAGTQTSLEANELHKASARIGHLFSHLSHLGIDQVQFVDQILLSLTRDPKRYPSRPIHSLVARIYHSYQFNAKHKGYFWLSNETFTCLVRHTCEVMNTKDRVANLATNLDIGKVVRTYQNLHKVLSKEAVSALIQNHAYAGASDEVEKWIGYLKEHYPGYENIRPCLWATVYVQGRRANLSRALAAFNHVALLATENGQEVDLKTWNVLMYARTRVDDLQGALEDLVRMLERGVRPSKWTYHPILEMMADRGDANGITKLMEDFRTRSEGQQSVAHYGSLMAAYIRRAELDKAETVLRTTVDAVLRKKILSGTLTFMFERLMSGYGAQRDVKAVERVFLWMKQLGIRTSPATYGALMAAMAGRRQAPEAGAILRYTMKKEGMQATAEEYAIQMRGFNNQSQYEQTVRLHERMRQLNIRQSVDSQVMYLYAKTELERKGGTGEEKQEKLTAAIAELKEALEIDTGRQVAASSPLMSVWPRSDDSAVAAFFEHLILVHGSDAMFSAVRELVELYLRELRKQGLRGTTRTASLRTLGALMTAHLQAKNYEQVEKLWFLAKKFADRMTPDMSLENRGPPSNILDLEPLAEQDASEGDEEEVKSHASATVVSLRPSAGRAMWLAGPLSRYLIALGKQERASDMLDLVPAVTMEGYKLDNRTWNQFIRYLCRLKPPFLLLAFVLTERFLMPGFEGWSIHSSNYQGRVPAGARKEKLQYMRKRYLTPQDLTPEYPTIVYLAWALKRLRHLESQGNQRRGNILKNEPNLERYVGDTGSIEAQAPGAFLALRTMPDMPWDPIQKKLLYGNTPV